MFIRNYLVPIVNTNSKQKSIISLKDGSSPFPYLSSDQFGLDSTVLYNIIILCYSYFVKRNLCTSCKCSEGDFSYTQYVLYCKYTFTPRDFFLSPFTYFHCCSYCTQCEHLP